MRKLLIITLFIAILAGIAATCEPAPTPKPVEAPGAFVPTMTFKAGTTSIGVGSTAASVTHNMSAAPSQVLVSWASASPAAVSSSAPLVWSSLITATGFTINVTNAMSNRPTITWLAIP